MLAGHIALATPAAGMEAQTIMRLLGAALTGIGAGGFIVCWAELFTGLPHPRGWQWPLLAGILAATLLDIPLVLLPQPIPNMVLALLPIIGALLIRTGTTSQGPTASVSPNSAKFFDRSGIQAKWAREQGPHNGTPPARRQPPFLTASSVRFALFCLAYSLPLGLFQNLVGSSRSDASWWLPLLGGSEALTLAVAAVDELVRRRLGSSATIGAIVMPVAIAGLLLCASTSSVGLAWTGLLFFFSQQLLTVIVYARACEAAHLRLLPVACTLAPVIVMTDVGLAAGMVVAALGASPSGTPTSPLVLGVAYALILVGFFSSKALRPGQALIPTSKRSDNDEPPELVAARVARSYELTPREENLLEQLLRGKSVPGIARDLSLSVNTVRSHVAHIYQKTGVHSKDELLVLAAQTASSNLGETRHR
ncbi:MAG: response regulator transcription factor [Coriobacteriia bacterium]|nr:response regulator transcription factor [Coriobacteriia bacterium]MBS5477070.1 response regulator transcription factor [Coriobacteriia bacterium]